MKTALVYVFPNGIQQYENMARRFIETYCQHPPGEANHELHVAVNGGGKLTARQEKLFEPLVPNFFYHDNNAKDLGAYLKAAWTIESDFMVCLGAPVFFHKAGWLDCMVSAHLDNGPGMFGVFGAQAPLPHLRTTGFGISPELFRAYPRPVTTDTRYALEHGPDSLSLWVDRAGFSSLQVAWTGVFSKQGWHQPKKADALLYDQHSVNQYGDL